METQTLPENPPPPPPPQTAVDYSANVDTSRAFQSVKEAVAVFGERFLTGEIYLPSRKPPFTLPKQETPSWKSTNSTQNSWRSCSSSRESTGGPTRMDWVSLDTDPPLRQSEEEQPELLVTSLKKLESELEETKKELKLLKERESETEVVLASLNAELRKNMSKIAKAEVAEKGVAVTGIGGGGEWKTTVTAERKVVKKKPIVPLLGDLFSKKKEKSKAYLLNPLYTSSQMHWI